RVHRRPQRVGDRDAPLDRRFQAVRAPLAGRVSRAQQREASGGVAALEGAVRALGELGRSVPRGLRVLRGPIYRVDLTRGVGGWGEERDGAGVGRILRGLRFVGGPLYRGG